MSRGEFLRVVCASCAVTCVNRAWLVRRKESAKQASVRDEVKALHVETEHRACRAGTWRVKRGGARPARGLKKEEEGTRGGEEGCPTWLVFKAGCEGVGHETGIGVRDATRKRRELACARLRVASGASRDAARSSAAELTRHCHCSATAADGPSRARGHKECADTSQIATNLGSERMGGRSAEWRAQSGARGARGVKNGRSEETVNMQTGGQPLLAGKEQPHVTANVRVNDTLALPN
ncbi:hypothetical protein ERJ75_000658300 [Trypanosoma vivax]|nr:hypothetical protein ERJ75_000658300 [Trypanosoma vivax]